MKLFGKELGKESGRDEAQELDHSAELSLPVIVQEPPLQVYSAYIINLDSTIRLAGKGEKVLPGFDKLVKTLDVLRRPAYFVSSNPHVHPQDFITELGRMGIKVPLERVFTPVRLAAMYLHHNFPHAKVLPVASKRFQDSLEYHGIRITHNPDEAEVVLVNHTRDFDYDMYLRAFRALTAPNQAKLVATSMARTRRAPDGGVEPSTRGFVRALESASSQKMYQNLGRPGDAFLDLIFSVVDEQPADTLFVSDSLTDDIRPVKRYGVPTALVVRTDEVLQEAQAAKKKDQPNFVLHNVIDIVPPYILNQV